MQAIVAVNKDGGIGFKGQIPWKCKEGMNIFEKITNNKTLIMGRKTVEKLPKLLNKKIICVTNNPVLNTTNWKNKVEIVNNFVELNVSEDNIIAGGSQIYKTAFENYTFIEKVHLSIIKSSQKCDTYFDWNWLDNFVISESIEYEDFTYHILLRSSHGEHQYLKLLNTIMTRGELRSGRNGDTLSLFKNDMTFDLRNGFPLLTTKKMFLRGILEEFLFFLRGDTDSTFLSKRKVRIWEGNTTKEFISNLNLPYATGVLGPMYGYQWRFFNAEYIVDDIGRPISPKGGIDQLEKVVNLIKKDPTSRRILMTAYNPIQATLGVLYPCHSIAIQFYVQNNFLDMFCYNRSQDIFLGVPFNIASSSLLLMVVSELTGKIPRYLYMTMGDTHIYSNHIEKVKVQMKRIPYSFPILQIPDISSLEDIPNLKASDFHLINYRSNQVIKAKMSA